MGIHIAVGEKDAIFVIAADAGGVGGHGQVDDSGESGPLDMKSPAKIRWSVWASYWTSDKRLTTATCRISTLLVQLLELVDCKRVLTFIMTPMNIANNDQPVPIVFLRDQSLI